ncbi:hypothetical protein PVAR5_2880 [Paecilomyces variotii No. 5]|uniref:Uncharacterized protein n=1 Tax=Byssochlamys spectabilis (strain No. 5 / NBRC 109023) TaxID=1356009 RepID=V5FWY8_BYSSN|nr:hypothetical protein PVAR5_2880 [Paecilomyces variotii No. 5]
MDSKSLTPAFGEADTRTDQAPYCEGSPESLPCWRNPTVSFVSVLSLESTATTPTASPETLSYTPEATSYSVPDTTMVPPVTSSSSTVELETPTATAITSTVAPISTTGASPSETASSDSSSHTNTKTTIAIVVPVVVGSVLIIAAIVAFLFWRRRRKASQNNDNQAVIGTEMSREAGPVFLPGNNRDIGQMDAPFRSDAAFRESVLPNYQHRNTSTPMLSTGSEITLMNSAPLPSNVPSPPPPRYSTISAREGGQLYNDDRHSILTIENLAALHGWEGSENRDEIGDLRDQRARSPFRDRSDGTSTISAISDMGSPTARRHGNGDEESIVSSLGDEHRGGIGRDEIYRR